MPLTKNALSRIAFLDELLADRHHYYSLDDLTEKCNERLEKIGVSTVTRRCIEKDIDFIEGASFGGNIDKEIINGKYCLRYADPSFSIFKKKLSDDEKNLLQETLSMLGQFEGLQNFEWLDDFKKRLEIEERRKIICFSNNPYLKNNNILGQVFNYISNRIVLQLTYKLFGKETNKTIEFFPYLLKQYNDRWYLIGAASDDGKILTFALDRIVELQPSKNQDFENPPEDFNEHFDDIIGVTKYVENPILHIVFWISNFSKDYVLTKPLHGSQKKISGEGETKLREKYLSLSGGAFFSIDCKRNYELIRELSSFGQNLLVLSPKEIQDEIIKEISQMFEKYSKLKD